MMILRRLALTLLLASLPSIAFAQADMAVTASDSPDPVAPDGNITYTVAVMNNGPSATTNAHLNLALNGTLLYVSSVIPAGWNCGTLTPGSGASITCTAAVLPVGTSNFTIVLNAGKAQFGINDQTITQFFGVNSALPDPVPGNDSVNVQTAYVTPDADLQVTASDAPDPVVPDGNITYTVNVTNAGPDAAANTVFNVPLNNTLLFQSINAPAGWNCITPPVGGGSSISCSIASMPVSTAVFTVVLQAAQSRFGINDQTIQQFFGANSGISDPNNANNGTTVNTAYVTPDADLQVTASDAPDPVFPDGNITYTVNVTNAGPDAAANTVFNVPLNNTLLFQSINAPAGWNCITPPVGGGSSISCSIASMPVSTAVFTVVLQAAQSRFGIFDQTIQQFFGANSGISDPNNANNGTTVNTAYVTPDADIQVTASDAPDPVFPDGNITYTVNVTNAGPDAAANTVFNVPLNNTLLFQSINAPAGWNCITPPVGGGTSISCSIASMPVSTAVFTVVLQAAQSRFGINDQTIQQFFGANSGVFDPNNANNGTTVNTAYVTPDADMQVTASDAPDPVGPNGNITYTVNVTNAGPDAAPNARLHVPMNGSLRFVSLTTPAGFSCAGVPAAGGSSSFTCTNPSLASGTTSGFTVVLKADPAFLGNVDQTITQNFTVNSDVADPNHANDTVDVMTAFNVPDANLSITASDAPDPVVPGNNITFSVNVANAGPDAATNTVVSIPLHVSLRFVSLVPAAGFNCTTPAVGATGTITCTNASLANGGSGAFTLVTQVDPALLNGPSGSIGQAFTIGSDAHDAVPANNTATTATAYQTPAIADLSITKTTAATTVAPGGSISYTITAHNNGPNAATNVVLTDALPASVRFQSLAVAAGFNCTTPAVGATGTITCNAATLANGATATFTLVTTVANNASGAITNNATIAATETDGVGGNNGGSSSPVAVGPGGGVTDVPTLSEWALLALAALLGIVAVLRK